MSAPCGDTFMEFLLHLQEIGILHSLTTARSIINRKWREKIVWCLEAYNDEKHWPWDAYCTGMIHRLDTQFGEGWRR